MRHSTKRLIVMAGLAGLTVWAGSKLIGRMGTQKAVEAAYYQAVGTEAMALASSYDYAPPPVRDPSEYDLVVPA